MKSYVGADEELEEIQQKRGFKNYREWYQKKIFESENQIRILKETQKEMNTSKDSRMKQQQWMTHLKQWMEIKSIENEKRLNLSSSDPISENRLVL